EALMQRYFLNAKAVKRETARLLERCLVEPQKKPNVRPLGGGFQLFNGQLTTVDPETFRARPADWVRIFNVALDNGVEIYGHTKELIADAVAQHGDKLRHDREACAEFLELLLDDR